MKWIKTGCSVRCKNCSGGKSMIERQVIVTWYTPEEKLPEDDNFVIATISGKMGNVTYDHALANCQYFYGEGWWFENAESEEECDQITVHAWCDLEPYGGGKE